MHCFVPDTRRPTEQSPSLQPALQVLLCLSEPVVQTSERLGDQVPPQEIGFAEEQVSELEPPWLPSQRHW